MPKPSTWSGQVHGRIGSGSILYLGPLSDAPEHLHYPVQIYASLNGEQFALRADKGSPWQSYSGAIIRSNVPHTLRANGAVAAMILISPESTTGCQPVPTLGVLPIAPIPEAQVQQIRDGVRNTQPNLQGHEVSSEDLQALQAMILSSLGADPNDHAHFDDRIADAMHRITEEPAFDWRVASLAQDYGLGARQFRHLFSSHLGISPRRFLQWARIEKAGDLLIAGRPIGEAALEAGFADAAHFTRCFRRLTGTVPSTFANATNVTHSTE